MCPPPPRAETSLEQARRHVAQAERHVAILKGIIAQLSAHGHDTDAALQLLMEFRATLTAMREHLAYEERKAREPR